MVEVTSVVVLFTVVVGIDLKPGFALFCLVVDNVVEVDKVDSVTARDVVDSGGETEIY